MTWMPGLFLEELLPGLKGVVEVDKATHYGKTSFQVRVIKERSART
jgi:hypothetical protein